MAQSRDAHCFKLTLTHYCIANRAQAQYDVRISSICSYSELARSDVMSKDVICDESQGGCTGFSKNSAQKVQVIVEYHAEETSLEYVCMRVT